MTPEQRQRIADVIIDRAETVTLLSNEEVQGIRERAAAGEFDDIFEDEPSQVLNPAGVPVNIKCPNCGEWVLMPKTGDTHSCGIEFD